MKSVLFLLLLAPTALFASVGFTSDPVWLSRSPAYEGEKISIYASLTNSSTEELKAIAYFRDNGTLIDSTPVSLFPGEARILTMSWTPAKGKHTLAVEIASSTIALPAKTKTASVVIIEKEAKVESKGLLEGSTQSASVSYSDSSAIQNAIGSVSPAVRAYSSPVFGFIDGWRHSFTEFLNGKTEKIRSTLADDSLQKMALEGKNDSESQKTNRTNTISHYANTMLLYLFEALALIASNALISYAIFLFLIIFICFKIFRYFRPAY